MLENQSDAEEQPQNGDGTWVGFVRFLEPLLESYGAFQVAVEVRAPFWRRTAFRKNRAIPVHRVEVDRDSWEICLHAPGLSRENALGSVALSLRDLHGHMAEAIEGYSHCKLVVSDERPLSKEQLLELARGEDWARAAIEGENVGEFMARLDLPVREIQVEVNIGEEKVRFVVRQ